MKKSLLIVGSGPGLSRAVAERFAKGGFTISLVSRNAANLEKMKKELEAQGVQVYCAEGDASNAFQLDQAITSLAVQAGVFDVVLYNAAVVKAKDILDETTTDLINDFAINVAGALQTLQSAYAGLAHKKGAFLLTGGGLGVQPLAAYGSLSIGKAGLRSLVYQLHDRLEHEGIYVGLLTVAGFITQESETHSPTLLAELFWKLYTDRNEVEIHQ